MNHIGVLELHCRKMTMEPSGEERISRDCPSINEIVRYPDMAL
jgi:hypothetical protein